jgi:hypothetical protein
MFRHVSTMERASDFKGSLTTRSWSKTAFSLSRHCLYVHRSTSAEFLPKRDRYLGAEGILYQRDVYRVVSESRIRLGKHKTGRLGYLLGPPTLLKLAQWH